MVLDQTLIELLYRQMFLIRFFENRLLELFSTGLLHGTTHTYAGQEAIAVSVINQLRPEDIIFSNHRCHGHYLARENDPHGLLAEIMGREGGICAGRGGSQHIQKGNFYSNGVQGGYMPIAVGTAMAEKMNKSGAIVVAFIGDGTFGEGVVYESLNIAALWKVPLLVVVENNRYAQSTPIALNTAGRLIDRVTAFGISVGETESNDIAILYPRFCEAVDQVRRSGSPHVEIAHTYRLNAHSKGDDHRDQKEIESWMGKDPLSYVAARLDETRKTMIEVEIMEYMQRVEQDVMKRPHAPVNWDAAQDASSPS